MHHRHSFEAISNKMGHVPPVTMLGSATAVTSTKPQHHVWCSSNETGKGPEYIQFFILISVT
jgi:hypothetical protein